MDHGDRKTAALRGLSDLCLPDGRGGKLCVDASVERIVLTMGAKMHELSCGLDDGALIADLLKLLLKIRARDIDVAPRLLARSDELEALAAGVRTGLPMLEGWRFDQFGHEALDLVEGRLAFAVTGGKLTMTRTAEVVD